MSENNTPKTNVVDLSSPLTIYNATEAAIAEIKKNYLGLTIAGVDDKDGYKAVAEGLRIVVGLRNKVDKRRQELKRHIDNGSKHILTELAPVETALKLQKDRIDKELERIKQEKEEAERLAFVARTQKLFDIGFTFNGSIYVLGLLFVSPTQVKESSEADWAKFIADGEAVAKQIADQKAAESEKARLLAEENERLRRELDASKQVQSNLDMLKSQGVIIEGKVTSAAADEEGVTVKTAVHFPRPAVNVSIPVRFEEQVNAQDDDNTAPQKIKLPQNTHAAAEPSYADMVFLRGFDACRSKILAILSNPEAITRKGLIDTITNLKP